jgi:hypothetical protein
MAACGRQVCCNHGVTGPGGQELSADDAAGVLTAAFSQPGGAQTVLGSLGEVSGLDYKPATAGRMFRSGTPATLSVGDWAFVASDRSGVRVQVRHVVRGVPLQTALVGPAEAGRKLAAEAFRAVTEQGAQASIELQSALYGIAVVVGLA